MRYCTYCGFQIPDSAAFCPRCGNAAASAQPDLVSRARSGEQAAIAALYEQTYDKTYYTVRSMIKDEDAVFDILQDAYIKAFAHLDSFVGTDEKFGAWIRQIAANTARDWLKKKKPMLFSELSPGEETEIPPEELFEDERSDHQPELVIDQEETARLIREILEELPEDQRAAIGMYYYEELSVKEIARAMGASENAVKSRLLYGRRKIEKKVRELEKKGTRLYGLAPMPFLLMLLRSQKVSAAAAPKASILPGILGSAAAKGTGAAAAGAAAGTVTGVSFVKTAVIVLAAVTAVGGGAIGLSKAVKPKEHKEDESSSQIVIEASEVPEQRPAIVEIDDSVIVIEESNAPEPVAVPEEEPESEPAPEPEPEPEPEEEEDPLSEAMEEYRRIIENAESYDFGDDSFPNGKYEYALEQMHVEDAVPTLLLCECGEDYVDHIRVFYYDTEAGSIVAPTDILYKGNAQIGGFRGGLSMMGDGNGILVTAIGGMRGDMYLSRAVRSGSSLTVTSEWTGTTEDDDPYTGTAREIIWHDRDDLSGLEEGGEEASAEEAPAEEGSKDPLSEWIEGEQAAGRTVFTGVVNTYSYDEAVELQGMPDWNAPDSTPYRIIVLDSPTVLHGKDLDGAREGKVELIRVNDAGLPSYLDGQKLTFSVSPDTLFWPSDTRIPVGQPGTADVHWFE